MSKSHQHEAQNVHSASVCSKVKIAISFYLSQACQRESTSKEQEQNKKLNVTIRPPYKSQWPTIPTQNDITSLLPDWSRGSYDSGELEWGRNRIGSSVMDDDFAHYVIEPNS